jgi:hypothetical protein
MLLTKLIQGLGALSLAHFALAEERLYPRTDETEGGHGVQDTNYEAQCWGCWKTVTHTETKTHTDTKTETCTVTETKTYK